MMLSLAGLPNSKKLTSLYIYRNKLTSIQEVKKLENLKELFANENQLINLQGVENLKKLKVLQAESNQLSSLKNVRTLKQLESLVVDHNQIVSIDEVTVLKNLNSMGVSFNKITKLPDLTSHSNLVIIVFRFNQLSESLEEIKAKLPKGCFQVGDDRIEKEYAYQNLDDSIDFTEPKTIEQINSNTTRIAGQIHMPAEKIQLTIEENINDDDDYTTYFYADVDENGNFVFDHLDLKKYGGRKCNLKIGICYDYDEGRNEYIDTGVRWYKIK